MALEEQGVPRRREDAGGGLTLVFAILIALLLLKGLGICVCYDHPLIEPR